MHLSIKQIFHFYKNLIIENKNWFLLALIILICGSLTGFLIGLLLPSIASEAIKGYTQSIDTQVKPGIGLSLYVFERNIMIATISSFLGVFLGLVPVFVTYVNGLILGFVFGYLPVYQDISLWSILVLILPHGLIEYLGTLIAMSFGLRFGLNWLFEKVGKTRKQVFIEDFKKLISIYPLVLITFILAALVEGLVTGQLACILFGLCI